jgi:uncharacterized RDD family membrane protein YckC
MMPSSLNFRALVPMVEEMNAIAQVSAAPVSGPKLDNRRVAAAIVDLLIVSFGAVVILVAGDSLSGERQGALSAVILGWALYYFFALESGEGQTVGKKLMKIRVVLADGRPAGMREVAVRTVLRVIDNYLVGLIVMLATGDRRQRIGDLAAGTIVVDASGPSVVAAAPVAVAEPEVAEAGEAAEATDEAEAVEVDEDHDADVEDEPLATQTITLPSRPEPPATLSDLTEPEGEEPAEPAAEDVADEPVPDEPVVEVEREPVVEVEPVPVARAFEEPVADQESELPPVASPAIEELADDVAAAHGDPVVEVEREPVVEVEEPAADEPVAEDRPEDDEPVNVKTVETVSAMDLVMGAAEERAAESTPESAQDPEEPASA